MYPKIAFKAEQSLDQRKRVINAVTKVIKSCEPIQLKYPGYYVYVNEHGVIKQSKTVPSGYAVMNIETFEKYSQMFHHNNYMSQRAVNIREIRNVLKHGLNCATTDSDKVLRIVFHSLLIGLRQFDRV